MADQVITTQDILHVVHDQQGTIASMSTFITAMHQRIMAGIGSQLSPQTQSDLNEIFAEVRGNTNAITQAIAANTDPDTGAPAPSGTVTLPPPAPTGPIVTGPSDSNAVNPIDQGKSSLSATVTTLSTSKAIANVGDTVTLTAAVSGKDGNPKAITGSVSFHDEDGMSLGNTTLDSTGVAALALAAGTALPSGDHEIVASYGGDASYASSDSQPLMQSVMAPPNTSAAPSVNVVEPAGQQPQT